MNERVSSSSKKLMKERVAVLILAGVTVVFCVVGLNYSGIKGDDAAATEIYSVVYTKEWRFNPSRSKRGQMLQITPEKAAALSTKELVNLIVEYPFLADIVRGNYYRAGFLYLYDEIAAFSELKARVDAGEAWLEAYTSIPIVSSKKDDVNWSLKLYYLEIILAQPEIRRTMDAETLRKIDTYATVVENKTAELPEFYSGSAYFEAMKEAYNSLDLRTPSFAPRATTHVSTPNGSYVAVGYGS